jgi:hypothetical protein
MNTTRTDTQAYEQDNREYWRTREFTYDYSHFYGKPRISYRPLRAALVLTALAMLAFYWLTGVM